MAERDADSTPEALVRPIVESLAAASQAIEATGAALDALPRLLRDWVMGEPDAVQALPIEVRPGPTAVLDAWQTFTGADACFVLPDPAVLAELPIGDGRRARVIVGTGDEGAGPAAPSAGVEVRAIADPPAWFAVEGERCGYPSAWSPRRPEAILVLDDPVAAGGFRMLFEELWGRAAPLGESTPEWEAVLRLLGRGLGEAEAAAVLHLSERTVRRRVREAGLALGASSRFGLGFAWAARDADAEAGA